MKNVNKKSAKTLILVALAAVMGTSAFTACSNSGSVQSTVLQLVSSMSQPDYSTITEESVESSEESLESSESVESVASVESVESTESVASVESVESTESVESVESVESTESIDNIISETSSAESEPNSAQSSSESSSAESENSQEPADYTKYALGNYYSISGEMRNIYNVSIARNGDKILVTLGISPQFKHLDKFGDTTRFYSSVPADYFVKRNVGKYWFKINFGKSHGDEPKTVTLELGQQKENNEVSIIGRIKCGDYSEEIIFKRL